jgi:hypothetical protein
MLRVPIETGEIDLDAPSLAAFEWRYYSYHAYIVLCRHCRRWNNHAPAEGHRRTHCDRDDCPYRASGYNMARVGAVLSVTQFARKVHAARRTVVRMIDSGEIGAMEYRNRLFIPTYDPDFARPAAPDLE